MRFAVSIFEATLKARSSDPDDAATLTTQKKIKRTLTQDLFRAKHRSLE